MEIQGIFESYSNKMTQIHLYQDAMRNLAKKELKALYKYEQSLENYPDLKELAASHQNMIFRVAKDGSHRFFGYKKSTIEDKRLEVTLHKNKQYQWLLAESYERFEDFLESAYAFAGFTDNNFWPLRDYGNISLRDIKKKPFTWFEERANKKNNTPSSIINKFRESFPEIAHIEINNGLNINLHLAIVLIEHLRHVIVHKGGTVSDKNDFTERVLNKAGLYNNGNPDKNHVSFIHAHFGVGEYKNTILLLEIKTNPEVPLDTFVDIFGALSGYLMAYAHLIFESLSNTHNKHLE
ncbi:MAG: hypothetical protein OEX07_17195 [Gammaproteobacteria bacterium]|nr:hypothetical protein [Gammaproteobacteria bacterium]